ncbi:hypothetical protein KFE98_21435 [bacterium SCSIO 12741]|nr:hypothetical protein KFE98_21435 [bacterium SCSIO 12741]
MKNKSNWILISSMILVAAMTRLLPHPPNFTPIGAMALFAGAALGRNWIKWILPIGALFISDLVLNNTVYAHMNDGFVLFHESVLWVYASMLAIVAIAPMLIRKLSAGSVLLGSLSASVLFFLGTNFGAWMSMNMYPMTWDGLMTCYAAGVPFFGYNVLGDLVFSTALFGGFYVISIQYPQLAYLKKS